MKLKAMSFIIAAGCGLMVTSNASAEITKVDFPSASPPCTLKQRVGVTDIEIDYSRPSAKGRDVFGSLVPYGKVWRTGANQATKIIFSTSVKLNGTEIPAGTYALFTIPGKDEWTVIINKGPEQWGAYKYDEKADIARIKATPVELSHQIETFTIEFNQIRDESSNINLLWDKTEVPIKVELDYVDKLVSQIEQLMSSDAKDKPYFQAAVFYYNHDQDLNKAKEWVNRAVQEREAFFTVYWQAKILAKLGDKEGALTAAKKSLELAKKANDTSFIKLDEDLISSLQ